MTIRKIHIGLILLLLLCTHNSAAQSLPDSLLTIEQAYQHNVVDMPMALRIIHTMRERQLEAAWKLDFAEGNLYNVGRLYRTALLYYNKVWRDGTLKNNWKRELMLLERMLYCYDKLNDDRKLPEILLRIEELATAHGDSAYIAISSFVRGKHNHFLGNHKRCEKLCLQAIATMQHTDYTFKVRELYNFYADMTVLYMADHRGRDAETMLQRMGACLELNPKMPVKDILSRGRSRYYALQAWLMARSGRMAAADSAYTLLCAQPYRDIEAERFATLYLKLKGDYGQMLGVIDYCRQIILQDGDSVSPNMMALLTDEGDAYMGLGMYREAAQRYASLSLLSDSLRRENAEYLTKVSQAALRDEKLISERRFQLTVGVACVVLLTVALVTILIYSRRLRQKNKAMMSTMHELMFYRDSVMMNGGPDPDGMGENERLNAATRRRFKEMDRHVMREKLFCNPDFGRDDLMRLLGVDKNALASIVHRYTGTNVAGYVNMKRMEYALSLLKRHPELTIAAISESCGLKSTTTFVNRFKEAYGMTPSEYRRSLETTSPKAHSSNM